MRTGGIVTLLTDFGPGIYSAAMKGVILSGAPGVTVVDICHIVSPQNIREAAFVLKAVAPTFPAGTVHCVVVDPGVGTERRIVLAEADAYTYLAPDNGVAWPALAGASRVRAFSVENEAYFRKPVSRTFHGRDIFAPVAAAVAAGERIDAFGPSLEAASLLRCPLSEPHQTADEVEGEIVFIDSFGNLVTNITEAQLGALGTPAELAVSFHGRQLRGIIETYGDARVGEVLALVGSLGFLEIAVACGSAAQRFPASQGDRVTVTRP